MSSKTLFTIGHSTLGIDAFINLLDSFGIKVLGDVRAFPMSRRMTHFNKPDLDRSLTAHGISYIHLPDLGGRRKFDPSLPDYGWKNRSFAAYAQYLRTDEFKEAVEKVCNMAEKEPTAIMCAEKLWWKCHRRMISDYLSSRGWDVMHIMEPEKADRHIISTQYKEFQQQLF